MAPSAAPTTSAAGSTFLIAHRRVNLDGGVSLFSPTLTSNLPATITPQSYAQSAEYLADQILVSNDSGTTWKLSPTQAKGAQSVATWSAGWTTVTNIDTQASVVSTLALGNFSSLSNPTQTLFVYNEGVGVQSFSYSFIDQLTKLIATQYSGLIQVSLSGVYSNTGTAPSTLYDSVLIWSGVNALNTHRLILGNGHFAKIIITLINFPAGGLSAQTINLGMQIVANQTSFPIGFADQWLNRTLQVDLDKLPYDLFTTNNAFSINVAPFMANLNGRMVVNYFNQQLNFGANNVQRWVAVLDTGALRAYVNQGDVPATALLLGRATSGTTITAIEYLYNVRPSHYAFGGGAVAKGLFVRANSTILELTTTGNHIGISLGGGYYATRGLAQITAGELLVRGDIISPGTGGKGFKTGGTHAVVLVGGATDSLCLCQLR